MTRFLIYVRFPFVYNQVLRSLVVAFKTVIDMMIDVTCHIVVYVSCKPIPIMPHLYVITCINLVLFS